MAGFFSSEMIQHIRPLLTPAHAKSHLRGLLLELLQGTDAAIGLQQELRAILHDSQAEMIERQQAYRNLDAISENDDLVDFDILVGQASRDSLEIASKMIVKRGLNHFGTTRALGLLNALAQLYPIDGVRDRSGGSRYFIRLLIAKFELNETRYLLNEFTAAFETMIGPDDPAQIARWTKPLVFRGHIAEERSTSVQALSSNSGLRRAIQIAAFDGLSTREDIWNAWGQQFYAGSNHSGLTMWEGDYRAIVDHAIAAGNNTLWETFIVHHSPYTQRKGPDELRSHMRAQARQSAELLRIWMRVERNHREQLRRNSVRFGRSNKSYIRMEAKRKDDHFANLEKNRAQIEAGQHWGWLKFLARHYLHEPHKMDEIVDDPQIVEKALLNCFDFLSSNVPTLEMLAESRGAAIAMVLHAACLATFRQTGSLEGIAPNILQAVKTDGIGGSAYQKGEAEKFEAELDKLVFYSDTDKLAFVRRYLEPQLSRAEDSPTSFYILNHGSTFNRVKGGIALDWLTRYPDMSFASQQTLFGIAAVHADRPQLNAFIETRCNGLVDTSETGQKRRKFWLLRHFFFIIPTSDALWAEFSADPKSIIAMEQYAGRLNRHDAEGWPQLNAEQVYRVLDTFVSAWPKVDLPNTWGTGDPEGETAYRFLSDVIFLIGGDDPSNSIPVFDRILSDTRFSDFHNRIRSLKTTAVRQLALSGFQTPRPADIASLLDESKIASVEDMRAVMIELLDEILSPLERCRDQSCRCLLLG